MRRIRFDVLACGLTPSLLILAFSLAQPAAAADQGMDLFVPAVARAAGNNNANFYSTLWITNPNHIAATVDVRFLETNQSNTSPSHFSDILMGGETRKYDNVLETRFGRTNTSGALRVVASVPVIASSRTFDLAQGGNVRDSKGLFFAGIPASNAVGLGKRTLLQGVSQGGSEDFRYNFGILETTGSAVGVEAVLLSGAGQRLASKVYQVPAFGRVQFSVSDLMPSVSLTNGVVDLGVISGSGAVMAFGTQIQNGSNDSSGFEMSFRGTTALSSLTADHCGAEAPGTMINILGKQYVMAEVIVATPDGREWVVRYPVEYSYSVAYRTVLNPACSDVISNCDETATSFCGYRGAFNVRHLVTCLYSSQPGSSSNRPQVTNSLSVNLYAYISLVSGYAPFLIMASYGTSVTQAVADASAYSYSFVNAPYPTTMNPLPYETEIVKFLDHVSVRAR